MVTTPRAEAASQARSRGSRAMPSTATMALSMPAAASAMAAPRKAASATAVSASNTPAACSAEYSPRDSPAAASGTMPFSASTAVSPAAKATMQGWLYCV